jgi:UDP-N-acetylglucosamine 2-epimerase (non-hydrolysing)
MSIKFLERHELKPLIAIVMGTRPGIIKLSPIVRALQTSGINYAILHTGQHYSYNMDALFFQELGLPTPAYRVETTKNTLLHGAQTAEMLKGLEDILVDLKPKIVVVGGDANTNLAGALAARKLGIIVAHVEAGLRSGDWRMPEEHNRIIIDHISEYLFAPTEIAKENLIKDNVRGVIYVTGNPIVDAVMENLSIARSRSTILQSLGLRPQSYVLATIHREENVDSKNIVEEILDSLVEVMKELDLPVILPVHPRTRNRLNDYGLLNKVSSHSSLVLIDPVGYLDFLVLLSQAKIVLTDSGGVQEEACILRIPCVTLRENTERPETVEVGANIVAGTDKNRVLRAVREMLSRPPTWLNPFGDGHAAERIAKILADALVSPNPLLAQSNLR